MFFTKKCIEILKGQFPNKKYSYKTEIDPELEQVVFVIKEGNKIKGRFYVDILNKKHKLEGVYLDQSAIKTVLDMIGKC